LSKENARRETGAAKASDEFRRRNAPNGQSAVVAKQQKGKALSVAQKVPKECRIIGVTG